MGSCKSEEHQSAMTSKDHLGETSGGDFEEADSKMALEDEETLTLLFPYLPLHLTVDDLALVSTHRI